MKLTIFILLTLLTGMKSESYICSKCRNTRDKILSEIKKYEQSTIKKAVHLCSFALEKKICNYYVKMLGEPAIDYSLEYIQKSDALCGDMFCYDSLTLKLKTSDFAKYLEANFPQKQNITSWENEDTFHVAVINDVHLQSDYQEGSVINCGQPAGCCTEKWGKDTESPGAGFWGTRESSCDIPKRTFTKTLQYMKGKTSSF
jgi:hypothetical protein